MTGLGKWAAVIGSCVFVAGSAGAQSYSGSNVGGLEWDRPFSNGSCCSVLGPVRLSAQAFLVQTAGRYTINSVQTYDGYLHLYRDSFDPNTQSANFVAGNDDGTGGIGTSELNDVTLDAGTPYILITSAFAAGRTGDFTNTIIGPAAVVLLGSGSAAFNPGAGLNDGFVVAAAGTSGRLLIVGADGAVRDAGQVSIAARNGRIELTRVADGTGAGDVTVSTSGVPGMMGNLYTWAEVTGFRSTEFGSGTGILAGNGLQIGADLAIGPNMVAGLSLGYSTVHASDAGAETDGTLTYVQPYFAYRSGPWSGTASLVYGVGGFEQAGGVDTADVTLAAATFEGAYDLALTDAFTLSPTVGLIHGREEVEGTGGALAGIDSAVSFSQGSLGARLTHSGADGTLFAGLHADYLTQDPGSILAADLLAEDGWTGRVEVGGEMALGHGMDLSTSVELSGIGGDMRTVSGGLRVALRF